MLATYCTVLWCGHRYGGYRYCLLLWKLLLVSHWMLWRWYQVSFSGGFSISALLRNLLIGPFENTILKYKLYQLSVIKSKSEKKNSGEEKKGMLP